MLENVNDDKNGTPGEGTEDLEFSFSWLFILALRASLLTSMFTYCGMFF